MYNFILLAFLALAAFLVIRGIGHKRKSLIITGVITGISIIALFAFMEFWIDQLWFEYLGYSQRFWTAVMAQTLIPLAGFFIGALLLFALTFSRLKRKPLIRTLVAFGGGLFGLLWGLGNWESVLKFVHRENTGILDPVFNMDVSFYLLTLPFLENIAGLFLLLFAVSTIIVFAFTFFRFIEYQAQEMGKLEFFFPRHSQQKLASIYRPLYVSAGLLFIVIAGTVYLNMYNLIYSTTGVVSGAGWTDVNIRIPATFILTGVIFLCGVIFLVKPLRHLTLRKIRKSRFPAEQSPIYLLGSAGGLILITWFLGFVVFANLFQRVRVEPNEISFERQYIEHNIEFTRFGFNLHKADERNFPYVGEFTPEMVEDNPFIFDNIRLWDWRALDDVYRQFQVIRLYYEFNDVDVDRYWLDDEYRQVMIAAREMEIRNLPPQSQTFVNQRFKYTHGYGVVLNTVNEFTREGLPNLLVRDIPARTDFPELELHRPEIYYGELTREHVYVNTHEPEFSYPAGDQNVMKHYEGRGGVELSSFWRRFLFGYKFDGTRLLFSGFPHSESRVMYHRQVRERVQKLAPFLTFDQDPYIVINEGKLYWIIDAYTTSNRAPYSEAYNSVERITVREGERERTISTQTGAQFHGINYIRNSVKAVVDAYEGTVDFYIFDEDDVLIRVWSNIFPDMFKSRDEMPVGLFRHVRYPVDFLLVQGLVYGKYHMSNPDVFYNQEDLWIRATEKYHGRVQPVEPYYIMWQTPENDRAEFVLIQPFTPRNRQVLIGWVAGMSDMENYGRFIAYQFPKDQRILGPQQVETKIDQDAFLSQQLTLWDQRGSSVIRGNVLAIPVNNTIFYVEPIYLQAQTAAYPELRMVVVMHGDDISYAPNFEDALAGIFPEMAPVEIPEDIAEIEDPDTEVRPRPAPAPSPATGTLIERANRAFNDYQRHMGEGNFNQASRALDELQETLRQLAETAE